MRGRGYARAVVAGSLLSARAAGVARAILFTGQDTARARRAYLALGFQIIGDYGLVLFA
jgi:predicted GNAT family acetyltransferase